MIENVPVGLGIVTLLGYFVWVCLQMATHALDGDRLLVCIFGAAALGAFAALAGLLLR